MHAKQECLVKIMELTRINAELKSKINDWERWYIHSYSVHGQACSSEVQVRMTAISGSARLQGNVAEHVFDIDYRTASSSEDLLRRAQRGLTKRHTEVEVWEMLRDSFHLYVGVGSSGATLSGTGGTIDDHVGASLLQVLLAKREVCL